MNWKVNKIRFDGQNGNFKYPKNKIKLPSSSLFPSFSIPASSSLTSANPHFSVLPPPSQRAPAGFTANRSFKPHRTAERTKSKFLIQFPQVFRPFLRLSIPVSFSGYLEHFWRRLSSPVQPQAPVSLLLLFFLGSCSNSGRNERSLNFGFGSLSLIMNQNTN